MCAPWTSAQTLDWQPFQSSQLNFSAQFPGTPKAGEPQVEKNADGSVKSTTTLFLLSIPNVISIVGVTDYTFDLDVDGELKLDQANFIKAIDGTLVTSRQAEYVSGKTKLPELIFTFEYPKVNYTGRGIIINQGRRIYMAVFAYKSGSEYSTSADKFLDSLELTGVPQK